MSGGRITAPRFEIHRRDVLAGGATFGDVGAYERVAGIVHFAVDPAAPAQLGLYDIDLIARGADGLVHVSADFWLLQPTDPARANGRLFFDLLNRGNKRAIQFFNDAPPSNDSLTAAQAGNGFLMRHGYAVFAVAWQGDVLPGDGRMTVRLPVAKQPDGSALSRVPNRADGTLVDFETWKRSFPPIPGLALPNDVNALCEIDFGPDYDTGREIREPPIVHADRACTVLVPRPDADGNDLGGLRAPMVEAPLGTYTGWNLRARDQGHGSLHDFIGSYIPLPETTDERRHTGDPRAAITERYSDPAAYVLAIRQAAECLVAERFILEEDVDRIAAAAADWGRPRHDVRLPG